MMHKNHMKTNISAGVAASSAYVAIASISIPEMIIVYAISILGAVTGQLVGPDLDIKTSTPARKGGGEFIALVAVLVSLYEIGLTPATITLGLAALGLLFIKNRSITKADLSYLNSGLMIANMFILLTFSLQITAGLTLSIFALILNLARKHRGVTHSLDMSALILISGYLFLTEVNLDGYIGLIYAAFILGYTLGYCMHILMDILGGRGVLLIACLNYRIKGLNIYHTQTKEEEMVANITAVILAIISIICLYTLL